MITAGLFIIGLIFGSFITMLSHRLVNGTTLWGRSMCVHCMHSLSAKDLIPLFSYFYSLGKCNYCGQKISMRYPVIELTSAIVFALAAYALPNWHNVLILCAVSIGILTLIITDIEHYIIPDQIQIYLAIVGILYNIQLGTPLVIVALNPLIYYSIFYILRLSVKAYVKRDPLGYGDIKLFAVTGLFIPISQLHILLLSAGLMGIASSYIWYSITKSKLFPFGPSLAIALYIQLFTILV